MKTFTYKGQRVFLRKEEYRNNGTLAILMFTEDGDLFSNVTVNLNHPLKSDDMAFLDENNLPGIGKWLEKRHLAIHMGVMVRSGFCTYPLYMLLDKHLQQ